METRYVKLEYNDAIESKKQLLNLEMAMLHCLRRLTSYRLYRRKELELSNKIKTNLIYLKTKANVILSTFPKEVIIELKKEQQKHEEKENKKLEALKKESKTQRKDRIQRELEEIQKRLNNLKNKEIKIHQ
jgi:hypothetical protein